MLQISPDRVLRSLPADLSLDEDQPVKNDILDIARVRSKVGKSQTPATSSKGAMGLASAVAFTVTALEAAFQGHRVVAGAPLDETGPVPVFEVYAIGSARPVSSSRLTGRAVLSAECKPPIRRSKGRMAYG